MFLSVFRCCQLDNRKGIQPVNNLCHLSLNHLFQKKCWIKNEEDKANPASSRNYYYYQLRLMIVFPSETGPASSPGVLFLHQFQKRPPAISETGLLQVRCPSCPQPSVFEYWREHKALDSPVAWPHLFINHNRIPDGKGIAPVVPASWRPHHSRFTKKKPF